MKPIIFAVLCGLAAIGSLILFIKNKKLHEILLTLLLITVGVTFLVKFPPAAARILLIGEMALFIGICISVSLGKKK